MSFALHKSGLAAVMTSITGATAGKLAAGYAWGKRDLNDPTLKYPFWTVEPSPDRTIDQLWTAGDGGQNRQVVASRITLFDRYENTLAQEDAFIAVVDAALTALRKGSNISLGQGSQGTNQGCIINRVASVRLTYEFKSDPPLRICLIDCAGEYILPRT